MSTISKEDVLSLREKTGAGLIDCKRALADSNGDLEEAISILRKKGVASAAKKAGRDAGEGIISQNISGDRSKGILVEVNCETDFVAKNDGSGTHVFSTNLNDHLNNQKKILRNQK